MMIASWRDAMSAELGAVAMLDLGYPQGDNLVYPGADIALLRRLVAEAGFPPDAPLLSFYEQCDGVSMPDVHVGYFIHSVELLLRGLQAGEPRRLTGPIGRPIIVFGTDGGGGRFALGSEGGGEVLHLGEGSVHDAIFDGLDGHVQIVASDLDAFLKRLLADVQAFVRGDASWDYMV